MADLLTAQEKSLQGRLDLVYEPEAENLDVFQRWIRYNNPGSLLINNLLDTATYYYNLRDREIEALRSNDDWVKRQSYVKNKLEDIIGPFPERTPLNVRITGKIKKEGYTVEKLVYESLPGYYVAACIFIPDNTDGRKPAVLHVSGHNQESFRADLYQVMIINLVKKGMIVLAIDPPGQGENIQYYDPEIKLSSIGYSVIEHTYTGNQCFLSGISSAKYFVWDGIRGIDYLVSRKDVDSERIGVTGFSGGGTITSYISAFDERVKVSVPCSWATANRRVLETKGAQDAETIFFRGLAEGITFEDLIEVRAPRPTLMTFVSRDQYLSLQGALEAYAEAKKAYSALGEEDNLEIVEDDFQHWMTPKIRRAVFSFFIEHFNLSTDPAEEKVELIPKEELRVTPTGQLSTSFGGKMIFGVSKTEAEKLIDKIEQSRTDISRHLSEVKDKAASLSGYSETPDNSVSHFINGRYQRDGYTVGKYAIMADGHYPVPVLLFVPDNDINKHQALIYLHPEGKAAEALPGGEIERFVKAGYIVAAVDAGGSGELKNRATRGLATGYTAVLTGRSIVGIQAGDISLVVSYLKTLSDIDTSGIGALAYDELCIPLIHAAAFNKSIKNITLVGSLISYRAVATNRIFRTGLTKNENGGLNHPYEVDFDWGVAGALTAYDIPDLIGCIAPGKVAMADIRDHTLELASPELIRREMLFPDKVYSVKGVPDNLKIFRSYEGIEELVDWSFR
jgi:dienelactone hydrolase